MTAAWREVVLTVLDGLLAGLIVAAAIVGIAAFIVAVTRAPSQPPAHFGNCPVGQHWEQPPGNGALGWKCVR
jgi:hypothetical protein